MDNAFKYVRDKGITTGSSYPYTAKEGTCKAFTAVYKISGWKDVPAGSCSGLETALNG